MQRQDSVEEATVKVGKKIEVSKHVNYDIKQLRQPFIKTIKAGIKYEVLCMCGKVTKIQGATHKCAKKACKFQVETNGVTFMLENDYFNDPENSAIRVAVCKDCKVSKLTCPTVETFFTYGKPSFTCACKKENKMYVDFDKLYSESSKEKMLSIWNTKTIKDIIDTVKEAKQSLTDKSKEEYDEKMADMVDDVSDQEDCGSKRVKVDDEEEFDKYDTHKDKSIKRTNESTSNKPIKKAKKSKAESDIESD
jgi:hypothetical protein